jgi:RimJ/RimL family protein N-acetyltransferase
MSDSPAIPELDTERLLLRAHRREDFADCAAMWADPEVVRFIGGKPSTGEQSWARLLRYLGHWTVMGYGFWAIEERRSGRFVGELGFADFRRDITPGLEGTPEAGWALAPWAHGQGYATEALRAALGWGDMHLPASKTLCLITEGHAASVRVAHKCGYEEFRRQDYLGDRVILLGRRRSSSASD